MEAADVTNRYPRLRDGLTAIYGSLACSLVVLLLDVVTSGSYLFAALICPIWFLITLVRTIVRRPSFGVAAARLFLPLLTLMLVIANHSLQKRIAMGNATRLIQACEQYREANGDYPQRLSDLVPRYLKSIPRAKYCLTFGDFQYWGPPHPILVWCEIPPFGRRVYSLDTREWNYLD